MHRTVLLALSFLATGLSFTSQAEEWELSTGIGPQYGAVYGLQASYQADDSRYFVALGAPGASVGFQKQLSTHPKISWGGISGVMGGIFDGDKAYMGITADYHVNGFAESGWVMGVVLGAYYEEQHKEIFSGFFAPDGNSNPSETAAFAFFNIGYRFDL